MVQNTPNSHERRVSHTLERLEESERSLLLRAVFEASPDMLLIVNQDGYPLYFNHHCLSALMLDEERLLNQHLSLLIKPDDKTGNARQQVLKLIKAHRPVRDLHWRALRHNGTQFPVDVAVTPLPDGIQIDGQPALSLITLRDETQRISFEERIVRLAHFDSVTGLINRNLLEDRARQAIVRARRSEGRMAFLFLDLDFFKEVNDHYGHQIGDRLLKAAGLRIQGVLRDEDTLGRLGGDEFLILVEGISYADDAIFIGDKVIHTLAEPFGIDGQRIQISASIGIALYPDHGQCHDSLLNHADKAMYQAKAMGRNKLAVYSSSLHGPS